MPTNMFDAVSRGIKIVAVIAVIAIIIILLKFFLG